MRGQPTDENLALSISDDGIGGADSGKGSGLLGLRDRVEALGGRMRIMSPAGSGTSLDVAGRHHPTRHPVTDGRLTYAMP